MAQSVPENVLDLERSCCQPICDIGELSEVSDKLQGAIFKYAEPITNGYGDKTIAGLIMYFILSTGEPLAFEAYPSEDDPYKLLVYKYSERKEV